MFNQSQNKLQTTLLALSRKRIEILGKIEYHRGVLENVTVRREDIEHRIDHIIHKLGES